MSVATQVLPIAPVLNGISGSCRTIFIDSPPEAHHTLAASAIVTLRFSRYRRLLFCFPDTSSKLLFCLSLSVFPPVCYLLDRFSACLFLCLYVLCLFSAFLFVRFSAYLFLCLYVLCFSAFLFVRFSAYLFLCLYVLYFSAFLFVCFSACLPLCLFLCLSILCSSVSLLFCFFFTLIPLRHCPYETLRFLHIHLRTEIRQVTSLAICASCHTVGPSERHESGIP